MTSLYLRIYLTLVALLLTFAFGAGWLFQRQIEQERGQSEAAASERLTAMAVLIHRTLPPPDAPHEVQAEALRDWGQRLRVPIALEDAQGRRIAASEGFVRREDDPGARSVAVRLDDGRSLLLMRWPRMHGGGPVERMRAMARHEDRPWWPLPFAGHPPGQALIILLVLLFLAVAISAYPVVRRLTRRLERLKQGVEQFGAGRLDLRIQDEGGDEVGALAASFNRAASQIETLLRSHQSLLANASHELRSPLARLKMAFAMFDEASPAQRDKLRAEIDANIGELDALVEEVLLASRLEAGAQALARERVELLGMAAEEVARCGAEMETPAGLDQLYTLGEERLLRRALRNLLENARRYGGGQVLLSLSQSAGQLELRVCDRGPGVPEAMRERIFEPFFRLAGHAEQAGGVGLGLSLVKQIAERHGGSVRCEPREGGGSCFVLSLPAA